MGNTTQSRDGGFLFDSNTQVLQERKAEHRIRKAEELAQKENKKLPTSADVDDNVDLISKQKTDVIRESETLFFIFLFL